MQSIFTMFTTDSPNQWPDDQSEPRPAEPIDVAELKTMRDMGRTLTLVDTRTADRYEREHLPGAVNVPPGDDFTTRAERWLPKRGTVVVYGDTPAVAAERLASAGWPVVRYLADATAEWQKLGALLGPFDTTRPVPSSWES